MKPTARDVARLAKTSPAAVSRAFRSGAPISPQLRAHILSTAKMLGYQPPIEREAARKGSGIVTLVAGDLENPFYPMAANALAQELVSRGRRLVLHAVGVKGDVDQVMDQVLHSRSDAVIVMSALMSSELASMCRRRAMPAVLFNRVQPDLAMTAVTCDNHSGGRMVAHRFLEGGRRSIAMIGGRHNTSTHIERRRGFVDALEAAGHPLMAMAPGNYDYDTSLKAAYELLASRPAPNAIFCVNDIMALAAIDAARELGLRIPDDVAVIGFDDVAMASWASYRLTTVRQPLSRMAAETADLVETLIADPSASGIIRVVPVSLVIRQTG